MPAKTDIRKTILDELERRDLSRLGFGRLLVDRGVNYRPKSVLRFLDGSAGTSIWRLEEMLDALDLAIVPRR